MVDTVEDDTAAITSADKRTRNSADRKIRENHPEIVAKIEDIFYRVTETTDTKEGVHLYTAWCEACKAAANDAYVIEGDDARQTLAEAGLLDGEGRMPKLVRTVMAATAHLDTRNLKP